MLLHEKLAEERLPMIEFRHTASGRQAYVKGTRVQVWMVILIGRSYSMNVREVADHLSWPAEQVEAAFAYAAAHPAEIERILEELDSLTHEGLKSNLAGVPEAHV